MDATYADNKLLLHSGLLFICDELVDTEESIEEYAAKFLDWAEAKKGTFSIKHHREIVNKFNDFDHISTKAWGILAKLANFEDFHDKYDVTRSDLSFRARALSYAALNGTEVIKNESQQALAVEASGIWSKIVAECEEPKRILTADDKHCVAAIELAYATLMNKLGEEFDRKWDLLSCLAFSLPFCLSLSFSPKIPADVYLKSAYLLVYHAEDTIISDQQVRDKVWSTAVWQFEKYMSLTESRLDPKALSACVAFYQVGHTKQTPADKIRFFTACWSSINKLEIRLDQPWTGERAHLDDWRGVFYLGLLYSERVAALFECHASLNLTNDMLFNYYHRAVYYLEKSAC